MPLLIVSRMGETKNKSSNNQPFPDGTLTNGNGTSASFGVYEKFRDGSPNGPPKIGFGYGVKLNNKDIQVYSQTDPCPCESYHP